MRATKAMFIERNGYNPYSHTNQKARANLDWVRRPYYYIC